MLLWRAPQTRMLIGRSAAPAMENARTRGIRERAM
jgi:hypothetical protein